MRFEYDKITHLYFSKLNDGGGRHNLFIKRFVEGVQASSVKYKES